jgi:hypothetical protein
VPWYRRMMGDNGILMIVLCEDTTDSELAEVKRVFAEATVVRGGALPPGE